MNIHSKSVNATRFPASVLDDKAYKLYAALYGENSDVFFDILNTSPEEISVISRMIAFLTERLTERKDVADNGFAKNCEGNRTV